MIDDINIVELAETDIDGLKAAEKMSAAAVEPSVEARPAVVIETDNHEHSQRGWIPGLVLIGLGFFFLLSNFTDFHLNNWWALFILIPAFTSLSNAVRIYRSDGHLGQKGRGSLTGGLITLFVAAAFLFNWDWSAIWPFFLIIGGASLLLNVFLD